MISMAVSMMSALPCSASLMTVDSAMYSSESWNHTRAEARNDAQVNDLKEGELAKHRVLGMLVDGAPLVQREDQSEKGAVEPPPPLPDEAHKIRGTVDSRRQPPTRGCI